jgi:hypothetical protein
MESDNTDKVAVIITSPANRMQVDMMRQLQIAPGIATMSRSTMNTLKDNAIIGHLIVNVTTRELSSAVLNALNSPDARRVSAAK